VNRGRALLFALLVYVTLDLSLPMMPGAFVFEPADSVASIEMAHGRAALAVAILPSPAGPSLLPPSSRLDPKPRVPPVREIAATGHPAPRCLPRATCDPPRPSEDPH
jgi:hypothetical protein